MAIKLESQFKKYYLVALIMALLLRIIETVHVYIRFNPKHLLTSELFGYLRDVFTIGLVMMIFYPVYRILHSKWPFKAKILGWFVLGLFVIMHITISEYFFYQLRPLDIFVFKHRPEEMAFSLNTAGFNIFIIPFIKYTFVLLFFLTLALLAEKKQLTHKWDNTLVYSYLLVSIVFIPLYFFVKLPVSSNLSINKSAFIYVSMMKELSRKVFGPDISKLSAHYQQEFPEKKYLNTDYPLLHEFNAKDQLSSYLQFKKDTPNLVIIISEGLADEFLHPLRGIHFMPFLDSLAKNSLYWDHFFTNGERSFAVTPSLMGSLPYGDIGFALLDQYPYHFSLVNVLEENGFLTSFYYGQGAWFHGMESFYKWNNIDRIIDMNRFDASLEKVFVGAENHFWGYNDFDLFRQFFISTDTLDTINRLDIFFTGTAHAPFHLKYPDTYHQKLDREISKLSSPEDKEHFEKLRSYYASLFNVDDALKYFFEEYSKRPDYQNTLFIITGDHPLTELPSENNLKKYHVPLIIFSPGLIKSERFKGLSSHIDIYETLMSYLKNSCKLKIPSVSTAFGNELSFSTTFEASRPVPIMNDNRLIDDFFYKGYFITDDNTLYKIDDQLNLKEYYDIKNWNKIYRKLESLRAASLKASTQNKLMPDSIYFGFFNYRVLEHKVQPDNMVFGPYDLVLCNKHTLCGTSAYIDINFKRWEHFDFSPQCFLQFYDAKGILIREQGFEIKSNQKACQFHIAIPQASCTGEQQTIRAVLRNRERHQYSISDLKVILYEKNPKVIE